MNDISHSDTLVGVGFLFGFLKNSSYLCRDKKIKQMFDCSNIIFERKLTFEDFLNVYGSEEASKHSHCATDNRVKEFSFVKKGETVITLHNEFEGGILPYTKTVNVVSPKDGYVRYEKHGGKCKPSVGENLFYISENNDGNPLNWDVSSLTLKTEEIDGKLYYSVSGFPTKYIKDSEHVSCQIIVIDDDPIWKVACNIFIGTVFPREGDPVHSLFTKETFKVKLKNGYDYGNGKRVICRTDWEPEENSEYSAIRYFAIGYPKKKMSKMEKHSTHPIIEVPKNKTDVVDACFVYIMRNNDNGAYKIGISKNPEYREKTLQSQEPNISKIFQFEFPSTENARMVEKKLHQKYDEYRMRGEWFSIPSDMVGAVAKDIVQFSM